MRRGGVWIGRPGRRLRFLHVGGAPSWSPDGRELALTAGGLIWVVPVDGGARRLALGSAPAWSPDGRQIAFVAPTGFVSIIAVRGGVVRQLGSTRAVSISWQSAIKPQALPSCKVPSGATVAAESAQAVVWQMPAGDWYGCLKALGQNWQLFPAPEQPDTLGGIVTALAGDYALLSYGEQTGPHGEDCLEGIERFDLRTGSGTPVATYGCGDWGAPTIGSMLINENGFATWQLSQQFVPLTIAGSGGLSLGAISCPSVSLCAVVGPYGDASVSTNPTAEAPSWSTVNISGNDPLAAVSCPSAALCVAVDENLGANVSEAPALLSSSDPADAAPTWAITTLPTVSKLVSVSCPTVSLCVTVGGADIASSTDPIGGVQAWHVQDIDPNQDLQSVSCASIELCVAMDDSGSVFVSNDLTAQVPTWTEVQVDAGSVTSPGSPLPIQGYVTISCPTDSLCVAYDFTGDIITSTNPTGGNAAWRRLNVTQPQLTDSPPSISCPSAALCVIATDRQTLASSDPTGGANAWAVTVTQQNQDLSMGVSCPTIMFCAQTQSPDVATTSTPLSPNAWTTSPVTATCAPDNTQCVTTSIYAFDDTGAHLLDAIGPGSTTSLSGLTLVDDTVSWQHNGVNESALLK